MLINYCLDINMMIKTNKCLYNYVFMSLFYTILYD